MQSGKDRIYLMSEAPVVKAIFAMSVPVMVGMIVQVFYNMVDTFFIGMMDDVNQLAAASIGFPFFMLTLALGSVVGVGSSSLVSRFLGMKKVREAGEIVSLSMLLNVAMAIAITPIILIFMDPILGLLGAKGDVLTPTRQYIGPLVISSVIIMANFSMGVIVRAEGAAIHAMKGMLIGTATNIVLDPIMIFAMDMGIGGAAWATVIGNLAGLLYYLSGYFGKSILKISFGRHILKREYLNGILSIGIPSGVNHALMSFAGIVTNNLASAYGPAILAAMGISQRINSLIILLLVGLATGCQPLFGYNYGAGNRRRLYKILKTSMAISVGMGLILSVIFVIFGRFAVSVFTEIPEVIGYSTLMLRAISIAAPFIGIYMICMNSLQAFGKALPSLILSMGRQGLFYIPILFLLTRLFGLNGLIFTQAIVDVLICAIAAILLRYVLSTDGLLHGNAAGGQN